MLSPLRVLPSLFTLTLGLALTACGSEVTDGGGGSDGEGGGVGQGGASSVSSVGGGGTGGSAAVGGGGGGGDDPLGPFTPGEPIDAPDDTWTWVDFPDSRCINDTPTGLGINPSSETDVVIFLMGGNACFNTVSCFVTANTNGYGATKFGNEGALDAPLFDRADDANPVRDFSFVFVPYCTGDVFSGTRSGVTVGGQERNFHGYRNMRAYLQRLVSTFPNAERVLLTGVSAGGFGAAMNYDHVAEAFGEDVDVILIDDSGPPMADEYLAPCLQQHFRTTWGMDPTFPTDCADCAGENGSFAEAYMRFLLTKYPTRSLGLISSEADETIGSFWSFGDDECSGINGGPGAYPAAQFRAGLEDLRDRIGAGENRFRLYMPTGTQSSPETRHVWLSSDPNDVNESGKNLGEWLVEALENEPTWASWPAP